MLIHSFMAQTRAARIHQHSSTKSTNQPTCRASGLAMMYVRSIAMRIPPAPACVRAYDVCDLVKFFCPSTHMHVMKRPRQWHTQPQPKSIGRGVVARYSGARA